MSRTIRRKRIDAANPLDRLTREQRLDLFQRRLSSEVSAACDKWLRSRGIPKGTLAGEYPGDRSRRAGDAIATPETACHGGESKV
jgi:hypothetical protein